MSTPPHRPEHPAITAQRNPPRGAANRPPVGSPLHESIEWMPRGPMLPQAMQQHEGSQRPRPAADLAEIADKVGAHA